MAATAATAPPAPMMISFPEYSAAASNDDELDEEELYIHMKMHQRQLEVVDIQEECVKNEHTSLRTELIRAQQEVKRLLSVPLMVGQFLRLVDPNHALVGSTDGYTLHVRALSTANRELLKPSSSVALHRHSSALLEVLPPEAHSSVSLLTRSEKPEVTYAVSLACRIQSTS